MAPYIYIYIYISILLQKKDNTGRNSLEEISFDFDAKKLNIIGEKWVDYKSIRHIENVQI